MNSEERKCAIMKTKLKEFRKILCVLLVFTMIFGAIQYLGGTTALAKTSDSAPAQNILFYVKNSDNQNVLLKVMSIDDLTAVSHGQLSEITTGSDTGTNYYYSCTDNLPTTIYTEAKGLTLPELVEYVKNNCTVFSAPAITYAGSDKLYFMATDGAGAYSRNWTYDQLYGTNRYYFPGIFDTDNGWHNEWEIDDGTYGPTDSTAMPIDIYNSQYKDSDEYYDDKLAVFNGGSKTATILATSSAMDRVPSLSDEITANGGVVTGCLADELSAEESLRLCIPQSEAELMSGNRTAYQYFAWVYNVKLVMDTAPELASLGTVAAPVATFSESEDGNTLYVSLSCDTADAAIYYSLPGVAGYTQTLYTGTPIEYDISGLDLAASPITFTMHAVKEGYADAGIVSTSYLPKAPTFTTLYTGTLGSDVTFTATSSVTESDWTAWSANISGIGMKVPSTSGYSSLDTLAGNYTIDDTNKTITFHKLLFTASGSYSFMIYADGYANKALSVTMKESSGGSYIYTLTPSATEGNVGDTVCVGVALNVNGGDYLLYGAGYRLVLDDAYVDLTNVSVEGNWQYGIKEDSQNGTTILTFALLDTTGSGVSCGTTTAIGSFNINLLNAASGVNVADCQDAILTDSVAGKRDSVSGSDLCLTIIDTGIGDTAETPAFNTDLPSTKMANIGDSITFTVAAYVNDGGILSYQWFKDDVAINGATNATYTINSIATSDSGSYKVIATNTNGTATAHSTSNICALTVSSIMLGDVNGDGDITIVDALKVCKAVNKVITLTADQIIAADVNHDGDITIVDALRICKYVNKVISTF